MPKKLKIWNGRGNYKEWQYYYVAAYSIKQAVEIINTYGNANIGDNEIRKYFHKDCWGDAMDGIVPTEPCLYAVKSHSSYNTPPIKLF